MSADCQTLCQHVANCRSRRQHGAKMGRQTVVRLGGHLAKQIPVTTNKNRLSRKLGVLRQLGNLRKINVSSVAKVMVRKCFIRFTFATPYLMSSCYTPNLAADIGFDNPLTPT